MQRMASMKLRGDRKGNNDHQTGKSQMVDACLRWYYRNCRWNFLKICIIACLSVYIILWLYGFPLAGDSQASRVFASTRDLRKRLSFVFSDVAEIQFSTISTGNASSDQRKKSERQVVKSGCSQVPPLPLVYGDIFDVQLRKAHISRGWIPRIIHQTWKSEYIPEHFVPFVQSWSTIHKVSRARKDAAHSKSDWLHVLWTDASMRSFVERYTPTLLPIYDAARFGVIRSDIFRLLVLAKYGGVYADVDVEARQPIDAVLDRHACLFASEPPLHALGILERLHFPSNALIACRANHPFMSYLVNKLPELVVATRDDEDKIVFKAGPEAINAALRAFATLDTFIPRAKRFGYKFGLAATNGETQPCAEDTVYVPSGDLFMPLFEDMDHIALARERCRNWLSAAARPFALSLRRYVATFCDELLHGRLENHIANSSYTVHHWAGTYRTQPHMSNTQAATVENDKKAEPDSGNQLVNLLEKVPSLRILDVKNKQDDELLKRASSPIAPGKKPKSSLTDWQRFGHLFQYDDIYIDQEEN